MLMTTFGVNLTCHGVIPAAAIRASKATAGITRPRPALPGPMGNG